MRPTVFQLLGNPAAGKFTVARHLATRLGSSAVLLDNHSISNPILALVGADGVKPIPQEAWAYASRAKELVLEAAEALTPPEVSFIFTNYVTEGPSAAPSFQKTIDFACRRASILVPVLLECDAEELARRVTNEDRRDRSKLIDPALLAELIRRPLWVPDHPNMLRLASNAAPADATAARILEHAAACAP